MPKRTEKPNTAINGYAMKYYGTETFARVFLEAIHGLDDEAETIGYPGLTSQEVDARMSALPRGPREPYRGPTMVVGAGPLLMSIIAFLKEPITKALVQVASSEFFKLVLPKIGKMFSKKGGVADTIQYPVVFRPAMYFEAEQVLVTAIMTIRKPEDYQCAETLVPQAFERAVDWLDRNGRQAPYLTYRIDDCKLNSFPTISHDAPDKSDK
jgi:hypothetical protein